MANPPTFLVIGFARTQEGNLRAEIVMKARDDTHAVELAANLAAHMQATIALSQTEPVPPNHAPSTKIIANYGDIVEDLQDWNLAGGPSNHWLSAHLPAAPVFGDRQTESSLSHYSSPGRARTLMSGRQARLSRTISGISAALVAMFAVSTLAVRASGAQRRARLVEMARPSCDHQRITNKDLRRLARYVMKTRTTKSEALGQILALCRADSRQKQLT